MTTATESAARDVLGYVQGVLTTEANAVSDNPIVFPETGEVLSGGNFHGMPVAVACVKTRCR